MFLGNYELLSRVRVGGMAEIYTARDLRNPERIVALKRILPSFTDEADYVAMFIDEANLGMRLKHPGIVESYELGRAEDAYFIALEYVAGRDTAALLRRAREMSTPVPVSVACRIGIEVCGALQYAHELCDEHGAPLGIVHRDVSPQNVLVAYAGDVKLIDFGIAKSTEQLMRTQAGLLKGKHGYLSPEQALGQRVDRRSDVFSLGICLYELLSADRLFQGASDFSTIVKVRSAQVPPLRGRNPNVPDELAEIIARALARDRIQRFQTAAEMADALVRFVEGNDLRCDREQIAGYMRDNFGEAAAVEAEPAEQAPREVGTGLLDAFDDLQPPSAVSALAEMPEPGQAAEDTGAEQIEGEADLFASGAPEPFEAYAEPAGEEGGDPEASHRTMDLDAGEMTQVTDGDALSEDDLTALADEPTRVVAYESTHDGQIARRDVEGQTPVLAGIDASDLASTAVDPLGPVRPSARANPHAESSPGAAAAIAQGSTLPGMGMDWDDEDLSTQLYDAPEGGGIGPGRMLLPPLGATLPGGMIAPGRAPSVTPSTPSGATPAPDYGSQPDLPKVATPNRSAAPSAPSPFGGMRSQSSPAAPPSFPLPSMTPLPRRSVVPSMMPPALGRGALGWAASVVALIVALLVFGLWLVREPARGSIHLTTEPADANVTLDGKAASSSVSPFVLTDVAPKVNHEIEVSKSGYRTWKTQLTVRAGQMVELPLVRLLPAQTPAQPVPIMPAFVAPAPRPSPAKVTGALSPAPIRSPVAAAEKRKLPRSAPPPTTIAAPKPRAVSTPAGSSPEPAGSGRGTGTLRVNSRPWSMVYVDGRLVGNTPQMGIVLGAGRHTVTLSNPEFGLKKTINVEIDGGQVVTKIVDLQ